MEQVPQYNFLMECDGDLFVLETIDPRLYPLGVHFAIEQLRWEQNGKDPKWLNMG